MSVEGTLDLPIEVIGGLVTNIAPSDLPHGTSPDCQDLAFQIGSGKTRPGVTALYTLANNPTVNSIATYETLLEIPRFVSLDSLGILRKDVAPGGALTPIFSGILPNSFFKSASLFGRQYFGFGNGLNGTDLPRQYDDNNFDRISQVGPGAAPNAVDENITPFNIVASPGGLGPYGGSLNIAAGPGGATEIGNTVTITTTTPLITQLKVGDYVHITGVGVGGYNGDFQITAIPSATTFQYVNPNAGLAGSGGGAAQFSVFEVITTANNTFLVGQSVLIAGAGIAGYNGTFPIRAIINATTFLCAGGLAQDFLGASGNGTVGPAGNITAGKHQLSVIFVTRSGYYTKPAPPNSWTANGGLRAVVTNIPTGPPNVIARVLCFTAAAGASFYHLGPTGLTIFSSNMYIADNVTTTLTVDFSDQVLLLGTLDDPLFNQIVLPPVAGVIDYSNRLFGWGEQSNLQSFLNLSFDGGFGTDMLARNFPLGWVEDAVFYPGGASALTQGKTAVFGDAYAIFGDGATATRGKISQGAAVNYLTNPIIQPNVAYTVRARILVLAANAGTVHINLQSTSQAFTTIGISLAFNQLTGAYALYSGNLTPGIAVIPSDLVLQVYADGTPNNTAVFLIDEIEIFPTNAQFDNSTLRGSKGQLNTQGQESFDSQTGLIQYSLNDGTSLRTCFKIRERLYLVKEHSFGATQDDGVNEPANWSVTDISKKVGTPSVNGVGIGEDWVVLVHRTGLYLYWGGEVLKISEEIQPTWDTINWQFGYTIAVTVDTRRRRILICAPFGASTVPNKTLVLDYHDVGSDASAIASNPPIHLTYTGAKRAFDRARKWCPWTIPANCVAQIEQSNGQTLIYFGSNDASGNVNQLDDTGTIFTDNGAAIPSYYVTSFLPDRETKQGLQLSQHRIAFQYLTTYSQGVGSIGVTVYLDTLSNAVALNPQTLSNPATKDIEMGLQQSSERMAVKFSSSGAGNWMDFQNLVLNVKPDPWAPVRGNN